MSDDLEISEQFWYKKMRKKKKSAYDIISIFCRSRRGFSRFEHLAGQQANGVMDKMTSLETELSLTEIDYFVWNPGFIELESVTEERLFPRSLLPYHVFSSSSPLYAPIPLPGAINISGTL